MRPLHQVPGAEYWGGRWLQLDTAFGKRPPVEARVYNAGTSPGLEVVIRAQMRWQCFQQVIGVAPNAGEVVLDDARVEEDVRGYFCGCVVGT